jgi:hypothetical protein
MSRIIAVVIGLVVCQSAVSYAGITSKAAKEAAEFVLRKFGAVWVNSA